MAGLAGGSSPARPAPALVLHRDRDRAAPVLTPRQHEVARLVSEGLTNRDVAEHQPITEHTAESHLERIRIRLGFRSRSHIAVWFVTGA